LQSIKYSEQLGDVPILDTVGTYPT